MLYLPLGLFVALAAFFFYALEVRKERPSDQLASALIDQPFPVFDLTTLDGEQVDHRKIMDGEVTLVNVWASWCPSCVYEHEFLAGLSEAGVRIVGLNYKDTSENAKKWLGRYGDFYAFHVFDPAGRLGLDLGVYGAPETYLVDAEGIIRYKRVGVVDERVWNQIRPLYDSLISESTGVQGSTTTSREGGANVDGES